MRMYTKNDMAKVVDAATGDELPDVPKRWFERDRDLVPSGVKRASGGASTPAKSASSGGGDAPARSATKAEWVAHATSEAAGAKRLSAGDAEKATHDDLATRFLGPPQQS